MKQRILWIAAIVLGCGSMLPAGVAANASGEFAIPSERGRWIAAILAGSPADSELVTHTDHALIPHGKCQYFHEKALETGGQDWMRRYLECENG